VWDAATGHPLSWPLPHQAGLVSAAFSPDSTRVVTASNDGSNPDQRGGGKATTASKEVSQLPLFSETADSPRGAVPGKGRDRSRLPARHAVPKSEDAYNKDSPAMTMEEVASDGNLRRAFQRMESNDGASGPTERA
jgi:hypothetical protein